MSVTLHLDYDAPMPLLRQVDYPTRAAADGLGTRYLVGIFREATDRSSATRPDTLVTVTTDRADATLLRDIQLRLLPGRYRLMLWADHTPAGSAADHRYDTRSWREVTLASRTGYTGSTEAAEAWTAETALSVDETGGEATALMARPQARYEVVSTDLAEFVDHWTRRAAQTRAPFSLDDYSVRIHYTGYLPAAFNLFADAPADSWTGVSYTSPLTQLSQDEALLAFDYVLVNHRETTVRAVVEVLGPGGASLGRSEAIDIPIARGRNTLVRGRFLTTLMQGGLGVDPEFAGTYDVYIQ